MKCKDKENSGSGYFKIMDGDKVILNSRGKYRQASLYHRGGRLFVEASNGVFFKLLPGGGTSSPETTWDEILTEKPIKETTFGFNVEA